MGLDYCRILITLQPYNGRIERKNAQHIGLYFIHKTRFRSQVHKRLRNN